MIDVLGRTYGAKPHLLSSERLNNISDSGFNVKEIFQEKRQFAAKNEVSGAGREQNRPEKSGRLKNWRTKGVISP